MNGGLTNKGKSFFTVFILVGVLSSCSPSSSNRPSNTNIQHESLQKKHSYVAPLTGLDVSQPITCRPIAIMINNAPAARPQSGLDEADIVYEVLAEGGITRLIAIFQSGGGQEPVGPIRSIRPYLTEIGESYRAMLVHAGGSPDAYRILHEQHKHHIDEISGAGVYFWRSKQRKAPHNLYSSINQLRLGMKAYKFEENQKNITVYPYRVLEENAEGEVVETFKVQYFGGNYWAKYTYDRKVGCYMRSVGQRGQVEKQPHSLGFANVIVLGADHKVIDRVGRLSVNIHKGGEAMLFQQGKAMKGRWVHALGDTIRFIKDETEVPLVPGKTFFHIVPNDPSFSHHVVIEATKLL